MRLACMRVALENTPATVELVVIRRRLGGAADFCGRVLVVPRPVTRRALHTFLHECAHIVLGHFRGTAGAAYKAEFEAERWAGATMRAAGIPVPRKDVRAGKRYVATHIWQALYHGICVDPRIKRWALSAVGKEEWEMARARIPRAAPAASGVFLRGVNHV